MLSHRICIRVRGTLVYHLSGSRSSRICNPQTSMTVCMAKSTNYSSDPARFMTKWWSTRLESTIKAIMKILIMVWSTQKTMMILVQLEVFALAGPVNDFLPSKLIILHLSKRVGWRKSSNHRLAARMQAALIIILTSDIIFRRTKVCQPTTSNLDQRPAAQT